MKGEGKINTNKDIDEESALDFQNIEEQAGAELGQAQLPTGILLYCDQHLLPYI